MPDAHWYLMALSVEPAHQRMGHGSALIRHGIQSSNDDGRPVYLETETAANVSFCESLGFEVRDRMTVEAYDLPFSLLVR